MPFILESKRKSPARLGELYPQSMIIDVTSRAAEPWVRFSPFYPHGDIPVPLSPGHTAASVEGIWQGLKVFAKYDIDFQSFTNTTMRGLKRTAQRYGEVRGHRAGVSGQHLLGYGEARAQIYLPAYRWVLDHRLQPDLDRLRDLGRHDTVVLLDYETNTDLANLKTPLSHAGLIIACLDGRWPE